MGTAVSVKQLLKIVCDDSAWNYAFFWRLIEDGSSMSLSWGDGIWDYSKSHNKTSVSEKSMELLSCLVHTYGEGIVGRVASTDTHSWIFLDKFWSDENYLDNWHLHFGTEMKSILFVPVLPHGVVQLGSLDVMLPDPMVVGHVKNLFILLDKFHGALHFSHKSANLASYPYPYGEDFSTNSDLPGMNQAKVLIDDASSFYAMPNMLPVYDFGPEEDSQCLENVFGVSSLSGDNSLMDLGIGEETVGISISMHTTLDCEADKLFDEFSSIPHLWEVYPEKECSSDSTIFAENSISPWDVLEQPFNNIDADIMYNQVSSSPLRFDLETELQSAFESNDRLKDDMLIWAEKSLQNEVDDFFQPDFYIIDSYFEGYVSETALVGHVSVASAVNTDSSSDQDDDSTNITDEKKPTKAVDEIEKVCQMENACAINSSEINLTHLSHVEVQPFCFVTEALRCPDVSEKNATLMINENEDAYKFELGRSSSKSPKLGKTGGKKGRKADVHRQRPRDRQMIQDRIKELRELIPDGEKCSIDALLERAANHMNFLRSVTSQAEKISKCRQSKEVLSEKLHKKSKTTPSESNWGSSAERSQPDLFPIVVENLDQPEQILVEVLCEEQSLFLEIGQVIRRLKLTILEGVLETRSKHRWASFIIETPRGFQQMEVVWALMQLLQTRRVMC